VPKVLVVQESAIVRGVFEKIFEQHTLFEYELADSYEKAKTLLKSQTFEYAIIERLLADAPKGEIIALCNKYDLAPIVFTDSIDEAFFESFEGANIVDYVIKQKYNNVTSVVKKLMQIEANKESKVLIVNSEGLFSKYLVQNLMLHNFRVFEAKSANESYQILEKNPDISLLILDKSTSKESFEIVANIRRFKSSDELRILAIADESNSYSISNLLHNGMDDYLIRPFSRTEFYVRIYQNIKNLR